MMKQETRKQVIEREELKKETRKRIFLAVRFDNPSLEQLQRIEEILNE